MNKNMMWNVKIWYCKDNELALTEISLLLSFCIITHYSSYVIYCKAALTQSVLLKALI